MRMFIAAARWLLVASAVAVSACATAPPAAPRTAAPAEGSGRIVFYRTSGVFGFGMRPDIVVDGKVVGSSSPGQKFAIDLSPGVHLVTVPNSVYAGDRKLEVPVTNRKTTYVKTWVGGSAFVGGMNVELMDAAEGSSESAAIKFAGS